MKTKLLLGAFILIVLVLPAINADSIEPGYKGISINNYITNVGNFPEYIFVSSGNIGPGMCPIQRIAENGEISGYYKFCSPSVYAIPANKFDNEKVLEINNNTNTTNEQVVEYFISIGGKEVIKEINTYEQVSVSSTQEEKTNYYTIESLEKTIEEPNKVLTERNYSQIIIYLIISLVALILIITFIKRKKWFS